MTFTVEFVALVLLALLNGLFAATEIAIVSVRRSRLSELAEDGDRRAALLLGMRDLPEAFLATVQVGITVVGVSAAAFGGARLGTTVSSVFEVFGIAPDLARDLGFVVVVVLVSYLTLVLGELVPKSLALRHAERWALWMAHPVTWLARATRPFVWILTASSNLLLRFFGNRVSLSETHLSAEELGHLVDAARSAGSVEPRAGEIAARALEFGHLRVKNIMVPRPEIVMIARNPSPTEAWSVLREHWHSRIPVYQGDRDHVMGYVTVKDLLSFLQDGRELTLRSLPFVPETRLAVDVLKDMQEARIQIAMVIDEAGDIAGLVTLEDLLEELVGDVFGEHRALAERIRREADGSVVVRGIVPVHEVNRELDLGLPEDPAWTTMAGLATALAGEIPSAGAHLSTEDGTTLDVLEASDRRVLTVRIRPAEPQDAEWTRSVSGAGP